MRHIAAIAAAALLIFSVSATAGERQWDRLPDGHLSAAAPFESSKAQFLLAKKWDDLSPDEKKRVKEAKDKYKKLPRDKKQKLRKKWEKMPEKERDKYKLERDYR